jgi:PAS domain S-box-containing protein
MAVRLGVKARAQARVSTRREGIRRGFGLVAGCVLAALLSLASARAEERMPRVLILNSYHQGYGWSDGELRGVVKALHREHPTLLPAIEYLDWRRYPLAEREPVLLRTLEQKYGPQGLDVIIALDDPALLFAYKYRQTLTPAPPIVFGGINHYTPETLAGQTDVTGVAESTDMTGTLDLALRLQPNLREMVVILDQSESALESRKALEAVMPHYTARLHFRFLDVWTVEALLKSVATLKSDTAVMVLNATKDAEGKIVADDVRFWQILKERCAVPIYMISEPDRRFFSDSNLDADVWLGVGGSLLLGEVHGEAVGNIALQVLGGESASRIPVLTKSPTRLAVDYPQMVRFGLPFSALPEGTEVFHRPASLYQMYRVQIIAAGSVIGLLLVTVVVLAINTLRRRRAETALRHSNERFQLIGQATNDALWDWNLATGEMWWNESYRKMLGVTDAAPPRFEAWIAGIHPDDREQIVAELKAAAAGSAQSWAAEYRYRRSDGTDGFVFNRACFLRGADGRAVRALGAMTDFTERKQAERRMRRLATAVEQATELIIVLDLHGALEYVNPAFERSTGFKPADVLGQPFWFILESEGVAPPFTRIAEEIHNTGSWSGRYKCRKKDGTPLSEQLVISPIRDQAGHTLNFILVSRDVTQEMKLEEQVRFSQKMEAIGLLAGGVAHDFNNILQIILGHTQMALSYELTEDERKEGLSQMKEASERAVQLTRQLLVFGRKQPLVTEDIDLNQLVADLLKMLRRLIGEHINVDFIPGHHLGNVRANRSQLEQVLLNLCVNARDAMPQGGRLTIELENVFFNSGYCEAHPWARPGRYVLMSVTDTGEGMDSSTLARIFDPFFSTKPKEKGTGLGLSVVYGVVQQHDGLIHVYSEPGVGTAFKIYLPIVERSASQIGEKLTSIPAQGTGTILLVEDEAVVRQLATRMLERGGYRVLTATNGVEALEIFNRHAEEISLLMLDAVMPNMGGRETYERISAIRPGLPVLFCSGYSADVLQPGFALGPGVQLIQKPYSPDEIWRRVHELLHPPESKGR